MSDATSPERLLSIFEMFEKQKRPMSLRELSDFCRIPQSTCHNLVQMLLKHAYLYQAGSRKDFYPTRRLYDLGTAIMAADPVLQRLRPVMEALREETRETIILGKRQKDHVVYLEVLEGPEVIRYSARAGDTKPMHSTCIGKCVLSTVNEAEVHRLLSDYPPVGITPSTITDIQTLMADLEQGRKCGFFTTRGENVADVTALSVPIRINDELFGLAVAGPSHRVDGAFDTVSGALNRAQRRLLEQGITANS